jgi:hypothetical protein
VVKRAAYIFSIFFFCSSEGGGGTYDAASMIACSPNIQGVRYKEKGNIVGPIPIASKQIFEVDGEYLYFLQSIINVAPEMINMSIAMQTRQQTK